MLEHPNAPDLIKQMIEIFLLEEKNGWFEGCYLKALAKRYVKYQSGEYSEEMFWRSVADLNRRRIKAVSIPKEDYFKNK